MLDRLKIEDFAPHLGQPFTMRFGEHESSFVLAEAKPIANPSPRATAPFRLLLESPTRWHGPQGLYVLVHPEHGELELFVVPIGPTPGGMGYEVIFN